MPTKLFISPSDLTFGFSGCHRCLWLKYNLGVTAPMTMPLVRTLSELQESRFRSAATAEMSRALAAGTVVSAGAWVQSTPIVIDGTPTQFRIRGKYDLLVQFDDGTHGVIDCKVSGSPDDKADFYRPQLEAYAFALESPENGDAKRISTTGLLVWTPSGVTGDAANGYGFAVDAFWQPIARQPERLHDLLRDFIAVISTEQPPQIKDGCRDCGYVKARTDAGL
ncbi:MAG: hypothetical protein EBU85_01700 [Actinobacteria bacterium]|nr:hypothetical protein [Actinomycetota bacterium]